MGTYDNRTRREQYRTFASTDGFQYLSGCADLVGMVRLPK